MHLISYISNATLPAAALEREIDDIVEVALKRNTDHGITGVLIYANQYFFQTIEGNESDLRKIFSSIENDPRHDQINKLIDEPVEARHFQDWTLDTYFVDNLDLINRTTIELLQSLYIHNFGVNATELIEFTRKMIDEMDTFKILRSPYTL